MNVPYCMNGHTTVCSPWGSSFTARKILTSSAASSSRATSTVVARTTIATHRTIRFHLT